MVSVILPTYNRGHLLKGAIQSVLDQSYSDLELIVIDDGSDDNTREVVAAITDPRLRYHYRPHSGYIGRLRNEGIEMSKGTFIALLDSDDTWLPGKLQTQMDLLEQHPSAGFCICDVRVQSQDAIIKEHSYPRSGGTEVTNIFARLRDNDFWVYPTTKIFRRECLEKTGMFREDIRSADFNFTIRLAYHYDAVILYEALALRLSDSSNRSTQFNIANYHDYLATFESLYQENKIEKSSLDFARWNTRYKIAGIYREKGKRISVFRNYIAALQYKPMHLDTYKKMAGALLS